MEHRSLQGIPLLEGRTPEYTQYNHFKVQNKRSLSDLDDLFRYQESLRRYIGLERAAEIEKTPDLFYNHEKFRIWQTKARFRAIVFTLVAYPAANYFINSATQGLLRRNILLRGALGTGIFVGSFYVFHRLVGYNARAASEQAFAKNVKMLRNIIVTN